MSNLSNPEGKYATILRAVDEGLREMGEPVVKALYYHVEKRAHIKREEIPNKLETFHTALVDLFDTGALILERRIAQSLCEILNLEYKPHNGWTLAEYVKFIETRTPVW